MPLLKQVLPAIIAQDQQELDQMLNMIPFAEIIMLDLMDGKFVGAKSLEFPMKLPNNHGYQLHVMAVNPLERLRKIPPEIDTIILHLETLDDVSEAIHETRSKNLDIYLALNPETPATAVKPYLKEIDGVLIMTVNPGQYGAKFLPEQLFKVRELRETSRTINIEVDGGMSDKTAGLAVAAGANMIASGSFIMKSPSPESAYNVLRFFLA